MLDCNKNIRNTKSNIITFPKQQEDIILFSYQSYPFLNDTLHKKNVYKTAVHMDFSSKQLQQIININHFNIIPVKKIAKNSSKNKCAQLSNHKYYSFFYQIVPFALKYILDNPNVHSQLFDHVISLDIMNIVQNVISFLAEMGIYYIIKIEDIGVNDDGDLKIYVPTTAVLQRQKGQTDKNYKKNINNIKIWWESYLTKIMNTKFKKEKAFHQLMPPQLYIGQLQNLSLNSSTLEQQFDNIFDSNDILVKSYINLKESLTSQSSAITQVKDYKIQRLKLIDKQLKDIKQKLDQKTKRKGMMQQSQQLLRNNSKNKITSNIIQIKHHFNYKQSPQILNKKKDDLKILNKHQQHKKQKNKKQQVMYSPQIDGQLYQFYDDQQDNISLNTYQVQFQHHFQHAQEKPKQNKIKIPIKRQLSEYSHQENKFKQTEKSRKIHKNSINQVQVVNKNINISAGPMFFNKMINKIRTQQNILGKTTSNFKKIEQNATNYIVQNEQDKNEMFIPKDKLYSDSLDTSYNRNFSLQSLNREINRNFKLINNKKEEKKYRDHSQDKNDLKKTSSFNGIIQIKQSKIINGNEIEQKVKKALEKTKNAIQMFKKVKTRQNTLKTAS